MQAIDTVHANFTDVDGLIRQAADAQRDGFTGKLAVHPTQVDVLNRAFRPDAEAVAYARRVVETFEGARGAGVISLDGGMLDRPHLARARRTLATASAVAKLSS